MCSSDLAAILAEPAAKSRELAEGFCELDDEQQADFFIACAHIMSQWKGTLFTGQAAGEWQMRLVGRHLRDCGCSNEDARNLVRELAAALEPDEVERVGDWTFDCVAAP